MVSGSEPACKGHQTSYATLNVLFAPSSPIITAWNKNVVSSRQFASNSRPHLRRHVPGSRAESAGTSKLSNTNSPFPSGRQTPVQADLECANLHACTQLCGARRTSRTARTFSSSPISSRSCVGNIMSIHRATERSSPKRTVTKILPEQRTTKVRARPEGVSRDENAPARMGPTV